MPNDARLPLRVFPAKPSPVESTTEQTTLRLRLGGHIPQPTFLGFVSEDYFGVEFLAIRRNAGEVHLLFSRGGKSFLLQVHESKSEGVAFTLARKCFGQETLVVSLSLSFKELRDDPDADIEAKYKYTCKKV